MLSLVVCVLLVTIFCFACRLCDLLTRKMAEIMLKECDRLAKKQRTARVAQLEHVGRMCMMIEEARDQIQNIGVCVCSHMYLCWKDLF